MDAMERMKAASKRIKDRNNRAASIMESMPIAPKITPAVGGGAGADTSVSTGSTSTPVGNKPLPKNDLTATLQRAGFTGDALRTAYAVVMAESGGNPRNLTQSARTRDQSYGLFQINMLGSMGPERRKQYGLKSNEDLFNPDINARIAYQMSGGGKNWSPWTAYKNGSYKKFL